MDQENPNMDFFKDLDARFDRDLKIRAIINTAMSGACRLMVTPGTRKEKAIAVAQLLQTAEEAIIKMFEEK